MLIDDKTTNSSHRIIDELENLPEAYKDETGDLPTNSTINRTKYILKPCLGLIDKCGIEHPDIHCEYGSIRIVWSHGEKTVKLVVQPNYLFPYLYKQEGEEHSATRDTDKLKDWLKWISSPAS